jgi:hypothetical protein
LPRAPPRYRRISIKHRHIFFHAPLSADHWGWPMTNVKLARRRFLHLGAGAATLPAVSRIARAQTGDAPHYDRGTVSGGRTG